VGGDVTSTQLAVPSGPTGQQFGLGGSGLGTMNASIAGLGLSTFDGTSDGIALTFTSLSQENISTGASPTQVTVQTTNYGVSSAESGQNAGQMWTFVFTDAASPSAGGTTIEATDAQGNVTRASHTIAVPLESDFTLNEAMTALQNAMHSVYFETNFSTGQYPTLNIAGNNLGNSASVQNLQPSYPVVVTTYDQAPLNPISAGTTTFILGALPSGVSLGSLAGAPA
jgi:hypothetical protein